MKDLFFNKFLCIFSLLFFFFSFSLSGNIALIVTLVSLAGLSLILKKSHTTSSQRNQHSSSLWHYHCVNPHCFIDRSCLGILFVSLSASFWLKLEFYFWKILQGEKGSKNKEKMKYLKFNKQWKISTLPVMQLKRCHESKRQLDKAMLRTQNQGNIQTFGKSNEL